MAGTLPTRGFISYSRTDSDFVDRLEADLRARGFETWVDRRRLEGAQNWEQEIFRGIDWCSLMVVVLSPAAAVSGAVEQEYRHALSNNKLIIPLLWHDCHIPSELEKIQYVDFHVGEYATNLRALLIAIADRADSRTSLPTDSRELYKQAIEARQRGDLERAAILLQRLVDREPGYANGEAARDLAAVNDRLYAGRAQRLRQEAIDARRKGEYGREAGALEALVALGPKDAWADEYLPIAQRNHKQLELYDAIQGYMDAGDLPEASAKLSRLWADMPHFGDPAGLAPRLGLTLPRTYEEDRERQQASDWKRQAEANAQAERDSAIDNATRRWKELSDNGKKNARWSVDQELKEYQRCQDQADAEWATLHGTEEMEGPLHGNKTWWTIGTGIVIVGMVVPIIVGCITIKFSQTNSELPIDAAAWTCAGFIGLYILVFLMFGLVSMLINTNIGRHRQRAWNAEEQAKHWYEQWHTRREQEHAYQLQQIQAAHQQRMRDIEAEYQRTLGSITRKYASSR